MKTKKNFLQVSIFTDLYKHGGNVALSQMLQWIKDGTYEPLIRPLRQALAKGNKKEYDESKKKLPAFTVSSVYDGRRLDENIIEYNGLIMVDIDHLTPEATEELFDKAVALPYAVAVFRSPSGCGLKIIVNPGYGVQGTGYGVSWPLTPQNHKRTFLAVAQAVKRDLGVSADGSGKDRGRLCFVSSDPKLFFDPERLVGDGVWGIGYGEEEKGDSEWGIVDGEEKKNHTPTPNPHTPDFSLSLPDINQNLYSDGNNQNFQTTDRLAGSHDVSGNDLPGNGQLSESGNVRPDRSDAPGGSVRSGEHSGGVRPAGQGGVSELPVDSPRLADRTGNASAHSAANRLSEQSNAGAYSETTRLRGAAINRITQSPEQIGLSPVPCTPSPVPLVSWPLTPQNHKRTFLAVAQAVNRDLGVSADGSGKDRGRLCFVSSDPKLFFDPDRLVGYGEWGMVNGEEEKGDSEWGIVDGEKEGNGEPHIPHHTPSTNPQTPETGNGEWGIGDGEEKESSPSTNHQPPSPNPQSLTELMGQMKIFNEARERVEQEKKYVFHNRNNYCIALAGSCRERKLKKENFIPFFRRDFSAALTGVEELPQDELENVVKSAWSYPPHTPSPKPHTPKKKGGTDTEAMLEWIPAHYESYYDEIYEHVQLHGKGDPFHPYNHRRDGSIILIEMRKAGIACASKEEVRNVLFSKISPRKNVPKDWFRSHLWNGQGNPFEDVCRRFHVNDPDYFRKTFKMWCIALVASLFEDDVVNHTIFVLQSDRQGIGKTRFWSLFLPEPLRIYYSEGVPDMRNKDAKVLMSRTMLINLDELGVLSSRSEVNNLKALLTMLGPIERGAYQEEFKKYIHRASFCAAVNDAKIITDFCGSRRHYIHQLDGIDDYNVPVPDEFWAQIFYWYTTGERYWLLPEEVPEIVERNEQHRDISLVEGFIRDYCILPKPGEEAPWYSISQIAKKLSMLTGMNFDRNCARTIGRTLAKLGFTPRRVNGHTQYQLFFKNNEQLENEAKE